MIQGIHKQRRSLADEMLSILKALEETLSPQERHSKTLRQDEIRREMIQLDAAVFENETFARELQGLLMRLAVSNHKSRHRSLVITGLEDVQSRLLRELGDKPEN